MIQDFWIPHYYLDSIWNLTTGLLVCLIPIMAALHGLLWLLIMVTYDYRILIIILAF